MFGSSNNLNHVPGYITSQKKLVAKILQVGAGGVIAGFSTSVETNVWILILQLERAYKSILKVYFRSESLIGVGGC